MVYQEDLKFEDQVQIMYMFEKKQILKFVVGDATSDIGDFEIPLLLLLANENKLISRPLKDKGGA